MNVLRARVRRVTGHTRHASLGRNGRVALPHAHVVGIVPDGAGAYLLLRFTMDGGTLTDTWHATVDEAKHQALVEYEIPTSAWEEEVD